MEKLEKIVFRLSWMTNGTPDEKKEATLRTESSVELKNKISVSKKNVHLIRNFKWLIQRERNEFVIKVLI